MKESWINQKHQGNDLGFSPALAVESIRDKGIFINGHCLEQNGRCLGDQKF